MTTTKESSIDMEERLSELLLTRIALLEKELAIAKQVFSDKTIKDNDREQCSRSTITNGPCYHAAYPGCTTCAIHADATTKMFIDIHSANKNLTSAVARIDAVKFRYNL